MFKVLPVPVLELVSDDWLVVDWAVPCDVVCFVESGVVAAAVPVACGHADVPPALLP